MNNNPCLPKVIDPAAWARFRDLALRNGLNPEDPWVGGYLSYEWHHVRYFFEAYAGDLSGQRALEFGCNVGASSIVLASLGAQVVGVDRDANVAALAQAQTSAYGVAGQVNILHIAETTRLPFPERHFSLIVCNSTLEYVAPESLAAVQKELLRVLAPGGLILVTSTSNRLWPKEVHSRSWFANYLPRAVDRFLGGKSRQRGVSPFTVKHGFTGCTLRDKEDGGSTYLAVRERLGTSAGIIAAMRITALALSPFNVTVGMLTPSFAMILRRPKAA